MKYNIIQRSYILLGCCIIFWSSSLQSQGQSLPVSKYGLEFINTLDIYHSMVAADTLQKMVNLQKKIPNITLDLRYASTNNFMHRRMYPKHVTYTFMRMQAANALLLIQNDLNNQGLGLKIFDAYRPYSVTEKFWELVHDDRYVADPKKGSGHNRGIAVDLTLIDLKTGKELQMPTGFDNFSDSAHHDFMQLPDASLKNRALLKSTMEKYGFIAFATEWWHYSLPDPEKYAVLDISFEALKKNK